MFETIKGMIGILLIAAPILLLGGMAACHLWDEVRAFDGDLPKPQQKKGDHQ